MEYFNMIGVSRFRAGTQQSPAPRGAAKRKAATVFAIGFLVKLMIGAGVWLVTLVA